MISQTHPIMKTIEQRIEEEYTEHNDLEDDEMYWTKEALKNCLNTVERKIFITYLEEGTYKATAKKFKVSYPTVKTYVNNLKAKIAEYVDTNISKSDNN